MTLNAYVDELTKIANLTAKAVGGVSAKAGPRVKVPAATGSSLKRSATAAGTVAPSAPARPAMAGMASTAKAFRPKAPMVVSSRVNPPTTPRTLQIGTVGPPPPIQGAFS